MLDEEQRQRIILHQEGLILGNVGSVGVPMQCEIAQCQIDGVANALIRMQGAKETAAFVFALSDRVAGGLRDATDFVSPLLLDQPAAIVDEPPPAAPPSRIPDFAYGFLCGLGAMVVVTMFAMSGVR